MIVTHPAQLTRALSPEPARDYARGIKANRHGMQRRCRGLTFVVNTVYTQYAAKAEAHGKQVFGTAMSAFVSECEAQQWLAARLVATGPRRKDHQ